MDLTPAALRETTFRGALRGYNVDDVDEFVEKVAVGMGELLEQLRQASERAASAERRAKEVATSEDAMRRTLGHAQKLAEAVLAEARQEAARVTEEAHQAATQLRAGVKDEVAGEREAAELALADAQRMLAEARAERTALDAEADDRRSAVRSEVEVERAAAKAQLDAMVARAAQGIDADLQTEIGRLHGVRQALQLDVAVLTSWMHDQRDAVRNVLVETLAAIDRAAPIDEPPPVADVDTSIRIGGQGLPTGRDVVAPAAASASTPPAPAPEPRSEPEPAPKLEPGADRRDDTVEDMPPATIAPREDVPPVSFPDLSDEEFLAELKKAAAGGEDSPFGSPQQGWPP